VLDLDTQAHATIGLGLDEWHLPANIYEAFGGKKTLSEIIMPTSVQGLDIVPSHIDLAAVEQELAGRIARENVLKGLLQPITGYDYIIIDTPPNLGILTMNAIVACSMIIVPLQAEYYAMAGYAHLSRTLEMVAAYLNHRPKQMILLTMYDARTKVSKQVAEQLREHFKDAVFQTIIHRNTKLVEAPSYGQPIHVYAPDSQGAIDYKKLAEEFLNGSK
jgi:chromosome partitioning protein